MAVFDSPANTYSDTTPHKRVISDVISLIDPVDTPLIALLGGLDGGASKFRFVNWPGKTVEWLEDTHAPLTDTMNESASITSTVTTITVTDASIYEPGDIIMVDSEYLWVSSAATATEVLTVTRGVGGSTAATHASTSAVYIIGQARLEGAESAAIAFTDRTTGSNTTQIFHQEVKVTRSHERLSQYGIASEMAYQRDKAVPQMMRKIERHLLLNKAAAAGSATTPRMMGGLQAYVTTNKVSGATLAQSQFENAVLSAWNAGGEGPWYAVMAPANVQKVKNFYDSVGAGAATNVTNVVLSVGQDTRTVGMQIDKIITPFGEVNLVMDRWAPTSLIYLLNPAHAGLLTYDPFAWEPLAKTGDYEREQVVGEFTFALRQEKAHALLTNVS